MKHSKVSARYAKSLLLLAEEKGLLEVVYQDMQMLDKLAKDSVDFKLLLKSPVIKTDKKLSILNSLLKGKVNVLTSEFVQIITRKKRESILFEIAEAFVRLYKIHKDIVTAKVETAVPLVDADRAKLQQLLNSLNYKTVQLEETVNPDLIGGIVLRIADKQIDASIRTQISKMRESLTENLYISYL